FRIRVSLDTPFAILILKITTRVCASPSLLVTNGADCHVARKCHPFYVDALCVIVSVNLHRIKKLSARTIKVEFSWISLRGLITLGRDEITPGLFLLSIEILQETWRVESVQKHEALLSLVKPVAT